MQNQPLTFFARLSLKTAWALLVALGLVLSSCADSSPQLTVDDAYVRQPPPGMKMTAGFATLTNPGSEAVVLTGAASDAFSSVSIHRSELVDGVARMRPVAELEVGPGESVVLEPGGLHLMFMGARGPLAADQTVAVTLKLADGSELLLQMPVRRQGRQN